MRDHRAIRASETPPWGGIRRIFAMRRGLGCMRDGARSRGSTARQARQDGVRGCGAPGKNAGSVPGMRDSGLAMENAMRRCLFLAVTAVLTSSGMAVAQNAPSAEIVNRGGGVAGTALGTGAGTAGVQGESGVTDVARRRARATSPVVVQGTGHIGAGTSGLAPGLGNAVGGIEDAAFGAGTGGLGDVRTWGSALGGVDGVGRGLGAGAGGIRDRFEIGINTGGVNGSPIGAGTGGLGDLNSLGAGTGGIREGNAPRFRTQ